MGKFGLLPTISRSDTSIPLTHVDFLSASFLANPHLSGRTDCDHRLEMLLHVNMHWIEASLSTDATRRGTSFTSSTRETRGIRPWEIPRLRRISRSDDARCRRQGGHQDMHRAGIVQDSVMVGSSYGFVHTVVHTVAAFGDPGGKTSRRPPVRGMRTGLHKTCRYDVGRCSRWSLPCTSTSPFEDVALEAWSNHHRSQLLHPCDWVPTTGMNELRSVTPFRIAVKDSVPIPCSRTGWRRWPKHDGLGEVIPNCSPVPTHSSCHFRMRAGATELEKSPFFAMPPLSMG